ncbi:MAG: geranylgeranyl reductase family protein [Bacteroidota bacterium]
MQFDTPVCIIGGGPGGAATALKLSYLGIPCMLFEKATFPRDKICGDAISGKVTTLLDRLDPAILDRFRDSAERQIGVWGIRFVAPNRKILDIPFQSNYRNLDQHPPGYVSRRMQFDHFLIEEVKRRENIEYHEGVHITAYTRIEGGYRVKDRAGNFDVSCQLLIMANGAHSSFSRKEAGLVKDPKHYAGAVRAYYHGVEGLHEDGFIELHFLKEMIPGYFWIFPLPNGDANVGLGMRSDILRKKDVNLRRAMEDIVANHPAIAHRFKNAQREGKILGYSLPLGSKKQVLSGDHYLLVGDAGHLIDPLTGEGIGNAVYSGFIAAELAEKCIAQQDFSAKFLAAYDVRVARVLGSEMRLSYRLQQLLQYPAMANFLASLIHRNRRILDVLTRMYDDFSVRKQLIKPAFWIKLFLGKQPD